MKKRTDLPASAHRLARAQGGVVTRRQLLGLGISRHVITRHARAWDWLANGVYLAYPGVAGPSFEALVWAGILLGGDEARAYGPTAALLDGLVRPEDREFAAYRKQVEILTLRQVDARAPFAFIRDTPGTRLRHDLDCPPRTRIEDTVLDLCAAEDSHEKVIGWLTRACQRRLTTAARLQKRATARRNVRHRAFILTILGDVAGGATTVLEHHALVKVLRAHGLPEPVMQAAGLGRTRVDALFAEYRVVAEFDGHLGHEGEGAFRDMRRDNRHTLAGMSTLRFGWADVVGEPCGAARQIGELLVRAGWAGELQPCDACPQTYLL